MQVWKVVESVDAVGGPEKVSKDGSHTRGPTKPGRYTLTPKMQFLSTGPRSWPLSSIRWGTPIRWDLAKDDVFYNERGRWHSVRQRVFDGDRSVWVIDSLEQLLSQYQYGAGVREYPKTWIFNDFGHVTYLLLDHGEHEIDDFIHSTPDDEYRTAHRLPVQLCESHGCVHVKPAVLDEMASKGYLKGGVHFVVHKFGELPARTIIPMKGSRRFELHFYPSARKIFVYGSGI